MYLFTKYDLRDTSGMGYGYDFRWCCKYCESYMLRDFRFKSYCEHGYGIHEDIKEL